MLWTWIKIYKTDAAMAETTNVAVAVHATVEALEMEPTELEELELPLDEMSVVSMEDEPVVVVEFEEEPAVTSIVEEPGLDPLSEASPTSTLPKTLPDLELEILPEQELGISPDPELPESEKETLLNSESEELPAVISAAPDPLVDNLAKPMISSSSSWTNTELARATKVTASTSRGEKHFMVLRSWSRRLDARKLRMRVRVGDWKLKETRGQGP